MEDVVKTFLTGYFPRHGLPEGIVSDCEFVNAFGDDSAVYSTAVNSLPLYDGRWN